MRGLTKPSDYAHFQGQCTAGLYKIAIFSRWTKDLCLGMRKCVSIPKSRQTLFHLGIDKMLMLHRQDMYKTRDFSLFFCLIKFRQRRLCFALPGVVSRGPNRQ
jgi:hypothetical protein